MENILIDTDVVIEYLRSKDKPSTELINLLQAEHDVFLSSISEFELFLGVKTDRHHNIVVRRLNPKGKPMTTLTSLTGEEFPDNRLSALALALVCVRLCASVAMKN